MSDKIDVTQEQLKAVLGLEQDTLKGVNLVLKGFVLSLGVMSPEEADDLLVTTNEFLTSKLGSFNRTRLHVIEEPKTAAPKKKKKKGKK